MCTTRESAGQSSGKMGARGRTSPPSASASRTGELARQQGTFGVSPATRVGATAELYRAWMPTPAFPACQSAFGLGGSCGIDLGSQPETPLRV